MMLGEFWHVQVQVGEEGFLRRAMVGEGEILRFDMKAGSFMPAMEGFSSGL